jgi:beta-N-acetylhexosaminidase
MLAPIMIDVKGYVLDAQEKEMIQHPLCGGVILFSRNFTNIKQLFSLCEDIKKQKEPQVLICVDHEGGRVQRFHQDFTSIPPMEAIGHIYKENSQQAIEIVDKIGTVVATELQSCLIDFSFTPVLDINHGHSGIIGDRAFSSNPIIISVLANKLMESMRKSGMETVGKHFPGHGFVKADSHLTLPVDKRTYEDIEKIDLKPFVAMIKHNIAAIMPAHIIYEKIDDKPAGFSSFWLRDILRDKLKFEGVIFSDDLSMAGAEFAGDFIQRAHMALDAGCDMVLICNSPDKAANVLESLKIEKVRNYHQDVSSMRLLRMSAKNYSTPAKIKYNKQYMQARKTIIDKFVQKDIQMDL